MVRAPIVEDRKTPKKKKAAAQRSEARRDRATAARGAADARQRKINDRRSSGAPQWKAILLGSTGVHVSSQYHSGGVGVAGRGGWHTGVDFSAPSGTPIRIPMAGTVVSARINGAFGNEVVVRLKNGDYMQFAHLSSIGVKPGQQMRVGSYVGKVGSTGNSQGPHLHLEIRRAATGGRWSRSDSAFYEPVSYLNTMASKRDPGLSPFITRGDTDTSTSGGGDPQGSMPDSGTWDATSDGLTMSDGGTGGMGPVKFNKKDFYASLEAMFGDVDVLLQLDKELNPSGGKSIRWAINKMVKDKAVTASRMYSILNRTAWFKTYGKEVTERLVWEQQKPEYFKGEAEKKRSELQVTADSYGVVLSDATLDAIARNAYVYGWNAEQTLDAVQKAANAGDTVFEGGSISTAIEAMEEYAYNHGVELTDADVSQLRNDVFDGGRDALESMREQIQQRSAQKYAIFADQINAGVNLRTAAGAYIDKAANLLEVDPNTVDLMDDPLFRDGKAFTALDAKGQPAMRQLWDFEKEIRKDPRWMETKNANETMASMGSGILQKMGLL